MKRSFLTIITALGCIVSGCKKDSNNEVVAVDSTADLIYGFSYSGTPCINDSITFLATEPNDCKYYWDFGDGSSGTISSPIHQYATEGTYTVSLTMNDTSQKVTNIITIYKDPKYTPMMAGTRTWVHIHYEIGSTGIIDSFQTDTTLAITCINNVVVAFLGDTLSYSPELSGGVDITFTYNYNASGGINEHSSYILNFDHVSDDITYTSNTTIGQSAGLRTMDVYETTTKNKLVHEER